MANQNNCKICTDHVAMISWLPGSTSQSDCPWPTSNSQDTKNLEVPISNSSLQLGGYPTQLWTMRCKEQVSERFLRMRRLSLVGERNWIIDFDVAVVVVDPRVGMFCGVRY